MSSQPPSQPDSETSGRPDAPPRRAAVFQHGTPAGHLTETKEGGWEFTYFQDYDDTPISLTLPVQSEPHRFHCFPPFFEGLLPEGIQLEALLRIHKIDRNDYFRQLLTVGNDLVGSVTVTADDSTAS